MKILGVAVLLAIVAVAIGCVAVWCPAGWIERANASSTMVIAFFAFVTAVFVFVQASSEQQEQRAWVLVKRTGDPERWYAPDKPGYFPGMVFEFNVFGETPARVIASQFVLRPVPAKEGVKPPEPDLPAIPDYGPRFIDPEIPAQGRLLPPDAGFQVRIRLDPPTMTEEQWEKLRDGKTIMCAYGFIEYKDAFGWRRKTRVCYIYEFKWGGVITAPDGTVLNPPGFRVGGPPAYNEAT
jgi:hypothetical protein